MKKLITYPRVFSALALMIPIFSLVGCAGSSSVKAPVDPADRWVTPSEPISQTFEDGSTFEGKRYANGLVEGTLTSQYFRFTSGTWQGDIAERRADVGEVEIPVPGGVIKTIARMVGGTPAGGFAQQYYDLQNGQRIVVNAKEKKLFVVGGSYYDKVEFIRADGSRQALDGELYQWLELAIDLRANANAKVTSRIGIAAEYEQKYSSVTYSPETKKVTKTESHTSVGKMFWGLQPTDAGKWQLALSATASFKQGEAEPPFINDGQVIVALNNGYIAKGKTKDGLLDGPVWLTLENIPGQVQGTFGAGVPQGALQEKYDNEALTALILPMPDGQWLRIPVPDEAVPCRIEGIPYGPRASTWEVPPQYCDAGGAVTGELKAVLSADKSYALLNVSAQSGLLKRAALTALNTNRDDYIEGGFSNGVFTGSWWKGAKKASLSDPVPARLVYQGNFDDGRAHGDGVCGYKTELEYCEYRHGERIDPQHQARLLAMAEAKRVSECESDWRYLVGSGTRFLKYVDTKSCDGDWAELKRMADVASSSDAGFFHPENSGGGLEGYIRSVENCYNRNFEEKGREAQQEFSKVTSRMSGNQCYDDASVSAERSAMDQSVSMLNRMASDGRSALSPFWQMQRQGRAAYYQQRENERRQLAYDVANIVRNTWTQTSQELAQIQANTNQWMAVARQNEAMEAARRQAAAANAMNRVKQQSQANIAYQAKQQNLEGQMVDVCKKYGKVSEFRDGRWQCVSDAPIVHIPWNPDRLCYDPTGKVCNTGEVYRQGAGGSQVASAGNAGTANAGAGATANGGAGGSGGAGLGDTGSGDTTVQAGGKTLQDSREMETRYEAVSYCWKTDNNRWRCHSPASRQIVSEATLEAAERSGVCDHRGRFAVNDGFIYMCNRPMESYDNDVYSQYSLQGAAALRKHYQCPVGGMTSECKSNQ